MGCFDITSGSIYKINIQIEQTMQKIWFYRYKFFIIDFFFKEKFSFKNLSKYFTK